MGQEGTRTMSIADFRWLWVEQELKKALELIPLRSFIAQDHIERALENIKAARAQK
jgi:hypothetical protein